MSNLVSIVGYEFELDLVIKNEIESELCNQACVKVNSDSVLSEISLLNFIHSQYGLWRGMGNSTGRNCVIVEEIASLYKSRSLCVEAC